MGGRKAPGQRIEGVGEGENRINEGGKEEEEEEDAAEEGKREEGRKRNRGGDQEARKTAVERSRPPLSL